MIDWKGSTKDRVERNVFIEPNSGCWLWQGSVTRTGYAMLSVGGERELLHRLAYKEYIGAIPDGLCVCHKCDVRSCGNPAHLFLGTHADNAQDRERKGRSGDHRGELQGAARLKTADVLAIRSSPDSLGRLALRYGVSPSQISNIRHRRQWAHLPEDVTP